MASENRMSTSPKLLPKDEPVSGGWLSPPSFALLHLPGDCAVAVDI